MTVVLIMLVVIAFVVILALLAMIGSRSVEGNPTRRAKLAERALDQIDDKARALDSVDHVLAWEINDIIKKYREELRN